MNKTFLDSAVGRIEVKCLGGDDVAENDPDEPSTMSAARWEPG